MNIADHLADPMAPIPQRPRLPPKLKGKRYRDQGYVKRASLRKKMNELPRDELIAAIVGLYREFSASR
jgi:hypothetical protein